MSQQPPPRAVPAIFNEGERRGAPSVAIVIPCLNEEEVVRSSLPWALGHGTAVIISDGGSDDGTVEVARQLGARVVVGPPGRGQQLNLGAAATDADILLFLHADTRLPADAIAVIRQAISDGADGGAFQVQFDDPRMTMRLGAKLINLRTRWTRIPLGDQGQFVTRSAFNRLRGFRDWPILEDLDFARRLNRYGKLTIVARKVITGARRFNQRGVFRTIATNWLIWGLFFLGVSPDRLAKLYRPVR